MTGSQSDTLDGIVTTVQAFAEFIVFYNAFYASARPLDCGARLKPIRSKAR